MLQRAMIQTHGYGHDAARMMKANGAGGNGMTAQDMANSRVNPEPQVHGGAYFMFDQQQQDADRHERERAKSIDQNAHGGGGNIAVSGLSATETGGVSGVDTSSLGIGMPMEMDMTGANQKRRLDSYDANS